MRRVLEKQRMDTSRIAAAVPTSLDRRGPRWVGIEPKEHGLCNK
jgi:hypothetical protein